MPFVTVTTDRCHRGPSDSRSWRRGRDDPQVGSGDLDRRHEVARAIVQHLQAHVGEDRLLVRSQSRDSMGIERPLCGRRSGTEGDGEGTGISRGRRDDVRLLAFTGVLRGSGGDGRGGHPLSRPRGCAALGDTTCARVSDNGNGKSRLESREWPSPDSRACLYPGWRLLWLPGRAPGSMAAPHVELERVIRGARTKRRGESSCQGVAWSHGAPESERRDLLPPAARGGACGRGRPPAATRARGSAGPRSKGVPGSAEGTHAAADGAR